MRKAHVKIDLMDRPASLMSFEGNPILIMTKKRIIFIAVWGNIIGFFAMRILGRAYDSIPSDMNLYISLIFLYILMGAPGAYFYAKDIQSNGETVNVGSLMQKIFVVGAAAFFLGLIGVMLGR